METPFLCEPGPDSQQESALNVRLWSSDCQRRELIGQVSDPTPSGYHNMVELNPQSPISKGPGGWEKENLPPNPPEFEILPSSLASFGNDLFSHQIRSLGERMT